VRPPGVKAAWDDCDVITQARIIAFNQVREYDELEERKALAGFGKGKPKPVSRRRRR